MLFYIIAKSKIIQKESVILNLWLINIIGKKLNNFLQNQKDWKNFKESDQNIALNILFAETSDENNIEIKQA